VEEETNQCEERKKKKTGIMPEVVCRCLQKKRKEVDQKKGRVRKGWVEKKRVLRLRGITSWRMHRGLISSEKTTKEI